MNLWIYNELMGLMRYGDIMRYYHNSAFAVDASLRKTCLRLPILDVVILVRVVR